MDFDTAILLAMVACAFGWFISASILEERRNMKAMRRAELDHIKRLKRLEKLYGRG